VATGPIPTARASRHQRVHERDRRPADQDVGALQLGRRAVDGVVVQSRQPAGQRQRHPVAEDRRRLGQARGRRAEPGKARADHRRDGRGRDGAQRRDLAGDRLDTTHRQRPAELVQQQRVAARGVVCRPAERRIGAGAELLPEDDGARLRAERARMEDHVGQPGEHRRMARPLGDGHEERRVIGPSGGAGEQAPRGDVGPLRVVAREEHRTLLGEAQQGGGEPPQHRPQVRVVGRRREDRSGGAVQHDVTPVDGDLEQLAHDAVGDAALVRCRRARQNQHARIPRAVGRLGDQPRLADPRRSLDRQRAPAAGALQHARRRR
jgi:hypothetical protein